MLLMAVDHVRLTQLGDEREGHGIGALVAHVPRIADHVNPQLAQPLMSLSLAEANERRRRLLGHVARQLQRVALGPARDAVARAEQRRNDVQHTGRVTRVLFGPGAHLSFSTSSSKYK